MTSATDLTGVAAVKQWLGLTSAVDDALVGALVTAVSQAILADLGRGSILPATYVEAFDGDGRKTISLRQWPVTRILSLTIDGAPVPASAAVAQAGFVLDIGDPAPPGAMQRLHYRGGAFPRGPQRIVATYRAGYEVTEAAQVPSVAPYVVAATASFGAWRLDTSVVGAAGPYTVADGVYTFTDVDAGRAVSISYGYVPDDLAQAAIEWVADRYAARTRIGQSAKTLGGQETTSFIIKAMPDVVDRLLRPYRRVAS